MKTRDVIRAIEADGWFQVRAAGSHRQFRHPTKPGLVTISFHGANEDVHPKTLASISRQSSLDLKGK